MKTVLGLGFLALLTNAGFITTAQPKAQISNGGVGSVNIIGGISGGLGSNLGYSANVATSPQGSNAFTLGPNVGTSANGLDFSVGSSTNAVNGMGSSIRSGVLEGIGSFSGMVPTVSLSQSANGPSPYVSNQLKLQPIYDRFQKNSKGFFQRYTSAYKYPLESHSQGEVIDPNEDVRLKHRWTSVNGKNHFSEHWSNHNTGVTYHHTIREALDGSVHEIIVAIDPQGNFQTVHMKTDAQGHSYAIDDCPNKSGSLLNGLELSV